MKDLLSIEHYCYKIHILLLKSFAYGQFRGSIKLMYNVNLRAHCGKGLLHCPLSWHVSFLEVATSFAT